MDLRVPMVFGNSSSSAETVVTRSTGLESWKQNFKVGVWKNFGNATTQQNVMDGYEVDYTSTAISDGYNWKYEGVDPNNDGNKQILRYWDLSAFPYDFRAVAPYLPGATIAADKITINASSNPFVAQTFINNVYKDYAGNTIAKPDEEVCLVSHVQRKQNNSDFEDWDVIKNTEINNANGKADATREVHMPFHHLVSKIGFRLYIDDPQPTSPDYKVKINSITITVVNTTDNFVIESQKYTATNTTGLLNGSFEPKTTAASEYTLLQHGEYKESDNTTDINFREHLSKENAIDLCSGSSTTFAYLQQIPQGNVKIHVVLNMETDHVKAGSTDSSTPFNFDQWLSLDKTNTTGDLFKWDPDHRYIYYLHIPNLHGHVIYVNTCEILPWDEVQTTDIPIGL